MTVFRNDRMDLFHRSFDENMGQFRLIQSPVDPVTGSKIRRSGILQPQTEFDSIRIYIFLIHGAAVFRPAEAAAGIRIDDIPCNAFHTDRLETHVFSIPFR